MGFQGDFREIKGTIKGEFWDGKETWEKGKKDKMGEIYRDTRGEIRPF